MTLLMRDQENIEKGIQQGINETKKKTVITMLQKGLLSKKSLNIQDLALQK